MHDVTFARFRLSISLLAFAGTLLIVALVYGYLATDGWYSPRDFFGALLVALPFGACVAWMLVRVRSQATKYEGPVPSYSSVLSRAFLLIGVFAACVAVAGIIGAYTTLYGGVIFVAMLMVGVPSLAACAFLMSWLARIFAQMCARKRSRTHIDSDQSD